MVRDKIPEIIKKSGRTPFYKVLSSIALKKYLKIKINEEIKELSQAKNNQSRIAELADCFEIINCMNVRSKVNFEDIESFSLFNTNILEHKKELILIELNKKKYQKNINQVLILLYTYMLIYSIDPMMVKKEMNIKRKLHGSFKKGIYLIHD